MERLNEVAEEEGADEAETQLRKELSKILLRKATSVRSTASQLQKSAETVRPGGGAIHDFVGSNLSTVRGSRDKTQRTFVEEDLKEVIARSTYAKLERGRRDSIRSDTVEELARALDTDPRLLLTDGAFFRALHVLLARLHDWRGKDSSSSRSIREALEEALHSDTREVLERIAINNGPAVSPEVLDCLLRLPPLDDLEYDTPATRIGAVLGWKWGSDLPGIEEDFVAQFIGPPGEQPESFPPLGGRIVGVVILGFFGYYLAEATRQEKEDGRRTILDDELRKDFGQWEDRHQFS